MGIIFVFEYFKKKNPDNFSVIDVFVCPEYLKKMG